MTVAPVSSSLGALTPTPATMPLSSGNAAGAGAAGSGQSATSSVASAALPPSATPSVTATALDALALKAAALAATSEGGLALLMADLAQAARIPGMPAPVQSAIGQVLAQRAPLDAPPTGAAIKAALASSTSSLPAAAANAAMLSDAALALTSSGGALKNALQGLQQVLTRWLADAPAEPSTPLPIAASAPDIATRQSGATPSLDGLAQALRVAGLPAPASSSLLALLSSATGAAAATPSEPTPAPAPASASPAAASASPAATPAEPVALPAALKLLLPAIEEALPRWLEGAAAAIAAPDAAAPAAPLAADTAATDPSIPFSANAETAAPLPSQPSPALSAAAAAAAAAEPDTPAAATTAGVASTIAQAILAALPATVDPKQAMPLLQQIFKQWFDGATAQPSSTLAPAAVAPEASSPPIAPSNSPAAPSAPNSPPPPYRGGPIAAQPAVPSTLPMNADPVAVGNRLLRETNAALAHQELLQIASLPISTQGTTHHDAQNPQWMFEIPFATPQGTAVAQFKISRDSGSKSGSKGALARIWRAQFSLDVEPMGPVHAQIVLAGDRTWVSLWAERAESVARLRQHEKLLANSLTDANFVAEVAFHAGAPRQAAASAGHFLDSAS